MLEYEPNKKHKKEILEKFPDLKCYEFCDNS